MVLHFHRGRNLSCFHFSVPKTTFFLIPPKIKHVKFFDEYESVRRHFTSGKSSCIFYNFLTILVCLFILFKESQESQLDFVASKMWVFFVI